MSSGVAIKPSERVAWIDCCKGICILLVVYGHVAGGLKAAGIVKAGSPFIWLREWIYLFHMPVFFFLSGLFAQRACGRPFWQFLKGKARTLAYPYLIWTGIILAAQVTMARYTNNAPDLSRASRFLFEPYGYGMWFLYSLILISLLFYGLSRLRIPSIPIVLIGLAVYALSMHDTFGFWPILNTSMNNAIFFILGGCFPEIATISLRDARGLVLLCSGVGAFVVMTVLQTLQFDFSGSLKLLMALLGISGAICLAMLVVRTAARGVCSLLGFYSLEIYVAHPLWATASRPLLERLGVHTPVVFIICGVLLGVGGSLILAMACQRFGFPYLFRWPSKQTGTGSMRQTGVDRPSTQTANF